jgi:hypothetical protein
MMTHYLESNIWKIKRKREEKDSYLLGGGFSLVGDESFILTETSEAARVQEERDWWGERNGMVAGPELAICIPSLSSHGDASARSETPFYFNFFLFFSHYYY